MKNIEKFFKEKKILYSSFEPMAKYTTLKIGGVADFIAFPKEDEIVELLEVIKNEKLPYYVTGGGSNLLVSDDGFRGVIINTKRMDRINIDGFVLNVSAGVKLGRIIAFLAKRNLSGMEGLVGIPGTVGGAIKGNAGSFGYEIKDCLVEIELIDNQLETKTLKKHEINFQYRSSGLPDGTIIKSACFVLKEGDGLIFERMKDFLQKKQSSQPLNQPSCGCVFKNPSGQSAGFLIEKAGLKGFRVGNIMISHVHANYFINVGRGKASDFLKLMDIVRERVFKLFGVQLEPEVKILGG